MLVSDYNKNYPGNHEKNCLNIVIVPYGQNVASPNKETRLNPLSKTHIDNIKTNDEPIKASLIFYPLFKIDDFVSLFIFSINNQKQSLHKVLTFIKKIVQPISVNLCFKTKIYILLFKYCR